jgi:hypothetical protein
LFSVLVSFCILPPCMLRSTRRFLTLFSLITYQKKKSDLGGLLEASLLIIMGDASELSINIEIIPELGF